MKTKVEDTLYATMDASVANLIIEGRLRTEKRNVAVMFSDLSGFTGYSEERPPELVIRDLNRYLADIEPVILAYRGHIDKYMGDGTMCEFGAPLDSDAYRLQAVLAAIKVQERVAAGDYPWRMRIGVASGLAITGLIGSRRQTYTAIGDVVNLASRLEKLAAPGSILIDRYTYEDVARFIEATKKRDLPLREVRDVERERQLEAAARADDRRRHRRRALLQDRRDPPGAQRARGGPAVLRAGPPARPQPRPLQGRLRRGSACGWTSNGTINIKGKRKRVEAFEVVGLRDPLADREKIPEGFYNQYRACVERIQVPADLLLPIEARDARIGHCTTVPYSRLRPCRRARPRRTPERMDVLRAGFLADIGMEIVPHHVLNRRGALSGADYEAVKKHPEAERAAPAHDGLHERARCCRSSARATSCWTAPASRGAARRRHPARPPHRGGRRRLRRADLLAPVPRRARPRRRLDEIQKSLHPRPLRPPGRRGPLQAAWLVLAWKAAMLARRAVVYSMIRAVSAASAEAAEAAEQVERQIDRQAHAATGDDPAPSSTTGAVTTPHGRVLIAQDRDRRDLGARHLALGRRVMAIQ